MAENITDDAEENATKIPKHTKNTWKLLGNLRKQLAKQLVAIIGIALAVAIGVVVARITWEWIQFVWSY